VVDTMLHGSPDLVIYRIEIWAQVGRNKVWRFLTQQLNCRNAYARRGVQVHCPAGIQSCYQTLCVSLAEVSVAKAHHDSMHH